MADSFARRLKLPLFVLFAVAPSSLHAQDDYSKVAATLRSLVAPLALPPEGAPKVVAFDPRLRRTLAEATPHEAALDSAQTRLQIATNDLQVARVHGLHRAGARFGGEQRYQRRAIPELHRPSRRSAMTASLRVAPPLGVGGGVVSNC